MSEGRTQKGLGAARAVGLLQGNNNKSCIN